MPPSLPPHALRAPAFPFRHLAALAGRAPIGGAREVALACFVAARLVAAPAAPEDDDGSSRLARSAGAKAWLGTLALPAAVRAPVARCTELSADGDRKAMAHEIAALAQASATFLDAPSRGELDALVAALEG